MQTYPGMNEQIVEILRLRGDSGPIMLYAAQRIEELERKLDGIEYASLAQRIAIEELEQQLREAREAAQEIQRDWLSPAEAGGLRQQLETERQARAEAEVSLQHVIIGRTDEQLADGIRLAVERLREVL